MKLSIGMRESGNGVGFESTIHDGLYYLTLFANVDNPEDKAR